MRRSAYHQKNEIFILKRENKVSRLLKYKLMNRLEITVGIIIDTIVKIPPLTGVTYRLYYLSKALQNKGIKTKIFLCNHENSFSSKNSVLVDTSDIEYHIIPKNIFYNAKKLEKIISKQQLDVLQFEDSVSLLRYTNIIDVLDIPVCLLLHDIEATLLGGLGFAQKDIAVTKAATALACKEADAIICTTSKDTADLINNIGVDTGKLHLVPNPIDGATFPYHGPNLKANNLIFIGNMYYWPNARAASTIVRKIFPAVQKECPDVQLTLVGLIPEQLKRNFSSSNIICTGAVTDINPYLQNATIGLCPVQAGSGMKVKILNYCAAGIPVVTTMLGQSGYEQAKGIIIENDLKKYPDILIKLLLRKARLKKLGILARNSIIEHFDINKIAEKMRHVYCIVVSINRSSAESKGKTISLAKPLWLREGRTPRIKKNYYCIIKHGSIFH